MNALRNLKKKWCALCVLALMLFPTLSVYAAGGGGAPIVIVSDTRKLTGIMYWWGSLYNESHWQFTLLTIVLIPLVGCIFGFIADIVMTWIGLDLKSRNISEH